MSLFLLLQKKKILSWSNVTYQLQWTKKKKHFLHALCLKLERSDYWNSIPPFRLYFASSVIREVRFQLHRNLGGFLGKGFFVSERLGNWSLRANFGEILFSEIPVIVREAFFHLGVSSEYFPHIFRAAKGGRKEVRKRSKSNWLVKTPQSYSIFRRKNIINLFSIYPKYFNLDFFQSIFFAFCGKIVGLKLGFSLFRPPVPSWYERLSVTQSLTQTKKNEKEKRKKKSLSFFRFLFLFIPFPVWDFFCGKTEQDRKGE